MTAPYDLSNFTNTGDLTIIGQATNQILDGWMGIGLILALAIIVFLAVKPRSETRDALAASAFVSWVMAWLFFSMQILNNRWLITINIITIVVALSYWKR